MRISEVDHLNVKERIVLPESSLCGRGGGRQQYCCYKQRTGTETGKHEILKRFLRKIIHTRTHYCIHRYTI